MVEHLSIHLFDPAPAKHRGFNALDLQEWELNAVYRSLSRHTTTKQIAKFAKIDIDRTRDILYDLFNLKLTKPTTNDCWIFRARKAGMSKRKGKK